MDRMHAPVVQVVMREYSWLDGFVGGLIGAGAQGAVVAWAVRMAGDSLLWPLALLSYAFRPFTEEPDETVFNAATGLAVYAIFAIVAGIIFASVAEYLPRTVALWVWGIVYALIIWAIAEAGVLRMANPTMAANLNPWLFLATQIVYGVVLGLYVGWRAGTSSVRAR